MLRGRAEDAGGLTPAKDDCSAVGGSAALRMRRTPCGYNAVHAAFFPPNFTDSQVSRLCSRRRLAGGFFCRVSCPQEGRIGRSQCLPADRNMSE